MEEFTVFIKVKIDNLKEFSNEIPEIVKRRFNNKRVIINNNNDKKYLLTSFISQLKLEKKCFWLKIFFGFTWEIKSFNENLNNT